MEFFETAPSAFSWKQVHKAGSSLRLGKPADNNILRSFLDHHALMCAKVSEMAQESIDCLLSPIEVNPVAGAVEPDSGYYSLSYRVKTIQTLVEKLRRMQTFPLENILDVSGIRFDCDLTLSEQTEMAKMFRENFLNRGIQKVEISDTREKPHSGYRAVHLHLYSKAGRSEFQIRTAMQAQWANLYELAGDIFGRSIRYESVEDNLSPEVMTIVDAILEASDVVHQAESLADELFEPFSPQQRIEPIHDEMRELRKKAYGVLEQELRKLEAARSKK
ncbi:MULTISPECIES: hypothetical protein [Corynebacterium]|uniref:hypothetical protein n=1 Tax=Corynebacterium TaxID=1716 RepID=UPI00257EC9C6|nr:MULTISPECIES: hypothetical protein [Corynebacterium]